MNDEQKVGNRIRLLRRNKGYTQQEFSEILGLSTNYLSDVERGKSFPRLDKLIAIMNTLDFPIKLKNCLTKTKCSSLMYWTLY